MNISFLTILFGYLRFILSSYTNSPTFCFLAPFFYWLFFTPLLYV